MVRIPEDCRTGASRAAQAFSKYSRSAALQPAPPCSTGQVGAYQPRARSLSRQMRQILGQFTIKEGIDLPPEGRAGPCAGRFRRQGYMRVPVHSVPMRP